MNAATLQFLVTILAASTATDLNLAQGLVNCANVENSANRLICYDTLGNALEKQLTPMMVAPGTVVRPEVPIAVNEVPPITIYRDHSGPRPDPSEGFILEEQVAKFNVLFHPTEQDLVDAFGAEKLDDTVRPPIPEEKLKYLAVEIIEVRTDSKGKFLVELDNGQLWQQKRDARIYFNDRELPLKSVISRNFMGGYRLSLTKRNQSMFVERMR